MGSINATGIQAGGNVGIQITHNHPGTTLTPSVPPALHQLPSPPDLTGRDAELAELEGLIAGGAAGATISGKHALHGMGGVGKTALAVALAYRLKGRWPDAQLFFDLRGADPQKRTPVTSAEAMRKIILTFHPTAQLPEEVEDLARIYLSVLADAGRVLLLLDNAADAAQVEPLLPPPNCLLIVTSRARFTLSGIATRSIDCLTPEKSRELLLRLAPRLGDSVDEAAALCGHLPLALQVFAGVVREHSIFSVSDLLARLRDRRDTLANVDAAFEISWELLAEAQRHRWALLSVFPASFDLAAAAAVWEEANSAAESMQALVNASLVEWNEPASRLRLHDLVRQFCVEKLSATEVDAAQMRHAKHYITVGAQADMLYLQGGDLLQQGLSLFDAERMHLDAAFSWLSSRSRPDAASALISLVDAVVFASALRLHPRERIRWQEAQRKAACLTANKAAEGNALGNLGTVYAALGETRKAIEFHEQALLVSRKIGDRQGESADLSNLGTAYAALGETRKAIEFHEQHLLISREIGNRRGEGSALGNLGLAYAALGETRKAIHFHEQALLISREIGDRRSEGGVLGNLGLAYADLGEPSQAIDFHEQRLLIAREIGDRRGEGSAFGNLGLAYNTLDEPRKAIEFHEQALLVSREIGDRRGEGAALGNIGSAYAALGETRKAIGFYEQHLLIAREIGNRHGEGAVLSNLGNACVVWGETSKAIGFYEQHLLIAREIGDRRGEGNALGNLGIAYTALGEMRKGIEFYEQHLLIAREIGDRRGEGNALGNLGNAHAALSEPRKAIEFHEQHLLISREIGNRRGEGSALGNLGLAYAALGETRKAIHFHEQALLISREIGDRRSEGCNLWNSASELWKMSERQEAISRADAALAIFEVIEDPNAVMVQTALAEWRGG